MRKARKRSPQAPDQGEIARETIGTSGSDEPPSATALAGMDAVLSTLSLEPYQSKPQTPPREGAHRAGYGINVSLPRGCDGRVSDGVVEAASFHLSQAAGMSGRLSVGRNDVAIRLVEHGRSDAPFVTAKLPLELTPTEFAPPRPGTGEQVPALTGRSFVASGKRFVLWAFAGSLPPNSTALAEANEALATLRIEPHDFDPGRSIRRRSRQRRTGTQARAGPPRSSRRASRHPTPLRACASASVASSTTRR